MISEELSRKRSMAGRIGGSVLRATHDPKAYTAAGRDAFLRRFEVDDPTLDEKERHLRAIAARRAFMLQLALKSARVRAKRMALRDGARKRGRGDG